YVLILRRSLSCPHPSSSAICTFSLHDALPISLVPCFWAGNYRPVIYHLPGCLRRIAPASQKDRLLAICTGIYCRGCRCDAPKARSEEHTSELQSRFDLVCRLLLEKKNNQISNN